MMTGGIPGKPSLKPLENRKIEQIRKIKRVRPQHFTLGAFYFLRVPAHKLNWQRQHDGKDAQLWTLRDLDWLGYHGASEPTWNWNIAQSETGVRPNLLITPGFYFPKCSGCLDFPVLPYALPFCLELVLGDLHCILFSKGHHPPWQNTRVVYLYIYILYIHVKRIYR